MITTELLYKKFLTHPSISTDTRTLKSGDLFFALKGERFNGNLHANAALEKGASYVVVDEPTDTPEAQTLRVGDVLLSLQNLAHHHRKTLGTKILAITGSNGKTTTKELIHAVLAKKLKVLATKGNFNNHIGVPLTLLQLTKATEIAIVEMGDNHPGEIAALCQIAHPNYGIITNVGKDHLEGFGTMEANIAAKKELFDFLVQSPKAVAFVNKSDSLVASLAVEVPQVEWFSADDYPKLKRQNPHLVVEVAEGKELQTAMVGGYNIENIKTAWKVGDFFGVEREKIVEAIEHYEATNNRSQIVNTDYNVVILDAYNANPSSVEVALESLVVLESSQPKAVILGEMYELGETSQQEHRDIAQLVASLPIQKKILCGKNFSEVPHEKVEFHPTKEDLVKIMLQNPLKGYTVLVKASRGMAFETLLPYL